jgi:DNA gyrase subunit A
LKVWKLPLAAPQARGKALINLLPLEKDERINTIMPLPEDEDSWETLDVMFATTKGTVRRNKLSDFVQVNRNGKIAMKLDEGDGIAGVETCSTDDDVLLTSRGGQTIRFPVSDVRVFTGRNSVGVRGIRLAKGDSIISMSILRHFEADPAERIAYLKQSSAIRRASMGDDAGEEDISSDDEEDVAEGNIDPERYAIMGAAEQFILTMTEYGYGKRSSSFDFRVAGRGGKGIKAIDQSKISEIGELVGAFPVEDNDQIMLVSDGGQLIRVPVDGIRFASRATKGVTVFKTAEGEKVVSVERISEVDEDSDDQVDDEAGDAEEAGNIEE